MEKIEEIQEANLAVIRALNSLGRLLHLLTQNPDEFIFKLNSLLQSESLALKYVTPHKALASPLRQMMAYAQKQPQKNYDTAYLLAISWVMFLWKPSRANLEDEGLLNELIECCVQWNCFTFLTSICAVSRNAQRLIVEHCVFGQLCKVWSKQVDEIIVEIGREKKTIKKDKSNSNTEGHGSLETHHRFLAKTLKFMQSVFNPHIEGTHAMEISSIGKENIGTTIKLIDKIGAIPGLQENIQLNQKW